MPQARVHNDNSYPHRELFKGTEVLIPAHGSVLMDLDDALQFEGQFFPMIKNAGGQQCPTSYKRIRIEPLGAVDHARVPLVCHANGQVAGGAAELAKMNEAHFHMLDDEARETVEAIKEKDAEIDRLRAALAAVTTAPKNKGGRPRKHPLPAETQAFEEGTA